MEITNLNSKTLIQTRAVSGKLTWKWPALIVFARLVLAVAAQGLVAVLFFRSTSSPLLDAGKWWPVYGTLIDLGCFFVITWRASQEGLRFRDLINFDPHRLGRDIGLGLVYILWFFPLAMVGILGFSLLIYGTAQPPSVYSPLPAWAAIYSLLVFPAIWGLMEQATYQGYALPRLEALWPRSGFAVALVAFGWGIQHIALPMTLDLRFMLFRFLSFIPLAVVMTLIYLRTRRLIPFAIAHWAVDLIGILTGIILPMMVK
jgi:uncharacterized protein